MALHRFSELRPRPTSRFCARSSQRAGDLDTTTRDGNNAVWLACKRDGVEAIELLSAAGANVHHRNPDGSTALIYAASAGKTEVVELLLALGADPAQENVDGFSALDLAANIECLQLLRVASRQQPRSAQS